jgi:hypothetical protein
MAVKYSKIHRAKEWYEVNESRLSALSLTFGFIFDSLTIQGVDTRRDNLWVLFNILLVGTCIILLNKEEREGAKDGSSAKKHFWLFNILQFSFGTILGTFFIFYFRSATLAAAWPFLLVILAALIGNEIVQKRYAKLALQISFFYLSLFSFAIYLVPIFVNRIGPDVFLLSGVVSLIALYVFISALKVFAHERFKENRQMLWYSIASIYVAMNVLYFANIIPPIPLSLKDGGVYHSVNHVSATSYELRGEDGGFWKYFNLRETVHLVPGEPLFAYSAVFSPADFNTRIIHEWQYKDPSGKWITATRIPLFVSGGRQLGFRTYSTKSNLTEGLWRVNVSTDRGQLIGRINFKIVATDTSPKLINITK